MISIGLSALSIPIWHTITFDVSVQIQRNSVVIENEVGCSFLCLSLAKRCHGYQLIRICITKTYHISYKLVSNEYWKVVCFVLFCLFCCFTSQVNSYGHGGTASSPNHTFFWASLNKQLTSTSCIYFCSLLTTTLLERFSGREETWKVVNVLPQTHFRNYLLK